MWDCEDVNVDLQIRGCEDVDVQLRVGRCRAADVGQISAQNQCAHASWNQTKTMQLLPKTNCNNAPRLRTISFQKVRYHHVVNDTANLMFVWSFLENLPKKLGTNMPHDLIVAWKFPWKSPKKFSTNMPWTIGMISLLHGNFHVQKSSVPTCREQLAWSHCCMEISMKVSKKAQYQHAVNDWHDLIIAWKFPWKSPNKLSTNMPWTIGMIALLHGNFRAPFLQNEMWSET